MHRDDERLVVTQIEVAADVDLVAQRAACVGGVCQAEVVGLGLQRSAAQRVREVGEPEHVRRGELRLLVDRERRRSGRTTEPFDAELVGGVGRPVEHHVTDVELLRRSARLDVIGPAVRRVGVDRDRERAVGSQLEIVARQDVDRIHTVVPEREVVLRHALLRDASVDDVPLVA